MKPVLTDLVRPQAMRPPAEMPEKNLHDLQDFVHVEEPPMSTPKLVSMRNPKVAYRTPVSPGALLGTWVNVNPTTRGLVKLVLRLVGPQFIVQAYGASEPTPFEWGIRAGTVYADSRGDHQPCAFTATFSSRVKETILAGHLRNNLLVMEAFHHFFTDAIGRSDYYSRELFRRE
jgi:hypothetical protein